MIDLEKLDKEIDELFEQETASSLLKWLLNKRRNSVLRSILLISIGFIVLAVIIFN